MGFRTFDEVKPKSTFKKATYLENSPGMKSIVRILDAGIYVDTHFYKGAFFKCPGADCPICKFNREMWVQYDKDAWKQPGYSGKSLRLYVNVMDLTPVKTCPNADCGHAVKAVGKLYPDACPKCGTIIKHLDPAPLNKIRVLGAGKKVNDQIALLDRSILDDERNPIGVMNFNIVMKCIDAQTTSVEETEPLQTTPVEFNPEDLLDLKNVVMELTPAELVKVQQGVSVRDIFAMRRASHSAETPAGKLAEQEATLTSELESVEDDIKKLFGDD